MASLARNEEMVDGTYRLGALIRRSVRSVVYETEFGEGALPAVIKIREMEGADAEQLVARLRHAGELAHPNLLKIYAAGSSVSDGVPVVYVVMERAEQSLQDVVAERALTKSETREMLVPTLKVLQYLHKKGYAHSRLSASNVMAAQDQLKLSSDSAIRVAEGGDIAEDMRALGGLIVQVLTQQVPGAGGSGEVPEPFADIARHCLEPDPARRWTVEQVQARLETPALAAVPVAVPSRRSPPVEEVSRAEETRTGIPKWIYAGLAALVLVVVMAAMLRRQDAPAIAAAPVVAVPAPAATAQQAPRIEVAPPVSRPHGRKTDGWSVIAGDYVGREPAEKRMRAMMSRWPNFKVSVSEYHVENTHYLVVLGQNLSEDQAEALRKRAVESGLPRDTYIKRVM